MTTCTPAAPVDCDEELEPHRKPEDQHGDAEQIAGEAQQRRQPKAEREPEICRRRGAVAVKAVPRPKKHKRCGEDWQCGDRPRGADRAEERKEHFAEEPEQRVRSQVRSEYEKAL